MTEEFFLKYVNTKGIIKYIDKHSGNSNLTEPEKKSLLRKFYYLFYTNTSTLVRTKLKFNPCPQRVKDKILIIPKLKRARELEHTTGTRSGSAF